MSSLATRHAYGQALVELGSENEKIVVLDGDLSKATMTSDFAVQYRNRFFNIGIAEANLMGIASGLASTGLIPFATTFAVFAAGRAYDQVRQSIAYPQQNVKIAASHGGLTDGQDGATHQMLEDLTLMRALPGMTVVVPADARETRQVVRWAAEHKGPVYIRLCRESGPEVNPQNYQFQLGKGVRLRQGEDISLIATGYMVGIALEAADLLERGGLKVTVVNMPSIKPLDTQLVLEESRASRLVVTIEDHSIIGGLGGAVAETMTQSGTPIPLLRLGVQDQFGCSASACEVLARYGLDAEGISRQIQEKWSQMREG